MEVYRKFSQERELGLRLVHVNAVTSVVSDSATPWTVAHQAPLSMGSTWQEYQSGSPCPPPGDLPNPRIKSASLISSALAGRFFTTSATWEAPSSWDEANIFCVKRLHFPSGAVGKNPPAKAGDMGLISDLGRFPHAAGQLNRCATATEASALEHVL